MNTTEVLKRMENTIPKFESVEEYEDPFTGRKCFIGIIDGMKVQFDVIYKEYAKARIVKE